MTLRIGWFTTARGQGSRRMFEAVREAIAAGGLDAELAFVFCNRERGESAATDGFLDRAAEAGAPVVTRSSVAYRRAVGGERSRPGEPLPAWRLEYDRQVDADLAPHPFDIGMLAGYMLILEREFVAKHAILNLHPALPDGPAGVWRAVIRELIRSGAGASGVMLHLAIAEVDAGPPVAYCRYPLRDAPLEALRARLPGPPAELGDGALEDSPLFAAIRERGLARESPLVVAALAEFAAGRLRAVGPRVLGADGRPARPADLSASVDARLASAHGDRSRRAPGFRQA